VARKKTRSKTAADDDFDGPTDCYVSYGGEMLWAIGYTPNGVPYGLGEDEMREVEAQLDLDQIRRERGQGFAQSWSDAKEALSRAFRALSSPTTKQLVEASLGDTIERSPEAHQDVGQAVRAHQGKVGKTRPNSRSLELPPEVAAQFHDAVLAQLRSTLNDPIPQFKGKMLR